MDRVGILLARAIAVVIACVGALGAFPSVGHATFAPSANRYCSAGGNLSNTADTVPGSLLSVNDVTLKIGAAPQSTASDCYGDFDPGNSSPTNETNALNAIFGAISGPNHLTYLDATGSASDPTGLGGITFVVGTTGGKDGAPGTWTVTWTDTNGSAPQNLPLTVDFVVLLNGGNNNAAYLLSSVFLPLGPTTGTGTFDIQFLNNGDKQPTISHLTFAGRIVSTQRTLEVPEPATWTMFGAGLLGLWGFRRRRSV